jgi:hypothetical protein
MSAFATQPLNAAVKTAASAHMVLFAILLSFQKTSCDLQSMQLLSTKINSPTLPDRL